MHHHFLFTYPVILLFLTLAGPAQAQFLEPVTFGGFNGNENGQHLLGGGENSFYVAGTFDAAFSPMGQPLTEYGQEDFFIGKINADDEWEWVKSGGSFLNDEIRVLRRMPGGDLIMAGSFWLHFTYEDLVLQASDNIKGIFVVRVDDRGNWRWGKVINGANLKEVNDVQIASDGEIFITGHFSEALQFDTLQLTASGENDAFLLRLSPSGALNGWQQLGYRGTTRGQTLALHPDGGYFWGGVYDDTLRLGNTELYANTFDRDVFISRFDATGQTQWIRRAGGVFEEELVAMATDDTGNLIATGFLIGVMTLSEDLSIQSRNGNPDIFLCKYSAAGEPQWARAFGGNLIDQPTTLLLRDQQVIIGGTYQGQIAWDGLSAPQTDGVSGFVAGFNQVDGSGSWLFPVFTQSFAFVEAVALNDQRELFALGSFRDQAQLGNLQIDSPGQYDFFLTGIDASVTATVVPASDLGIRLYPNPVRDILQIESPGLPLEIKIFDGFGRQISAHKVVGAKHRLPVNALTSGSYWVLIQQEAKVGILPLVVFRN